jgi:hypothetical protein
MGFLENESHITQEILLEYWYTIPPCRTHFQHISRRFPVALRTGYLREMSAECAGNLREREKIYTNFRVDVFFSSLPFVFCFFRVFFNEIGLHRSLNLFPQLFRLIHSCVQNVCNRHKKGPYIF